MDPLVLGIIAGSISGIISLAALLYLLIIVFRKESSIRSRLIARNVLIAVYGLLVMGNIVLSFGKLRGGLLYVFAAIVLVSLFKYRTSWKQPARMLFLVCQIVAGVVVSAAVFFFVGLATLFMAGGDLRS